MNSEYPIVRMRRWISMKDLPVCGFSHNYVRYQHTSVRIVLTSDLAACDNKLVESIEYLCDALALQTRDYFIYSRGLISSHFASLAIEIVFR